VLWVPCDSVVQAGMAGRQAGSQAGSSAELARKRHASVRKARAHMPHVFAKRQLVPCSPDRLLRCTPWWLQELTKPATCWAEPGACLGLPATALTADLQRDRVRDGKRCQ